MWGGWNRWLIDLSLEAHPAVRRRAERRPREKVLPAALHIESQGQSTSLSSHPFTHFIIRWTAGFPGCQAFLDEVLLHVLDRVARVQNQALDQGGAMAFASVCDSLRSHAIDGYHIVAVDGNEGKSVAPWFAWDIGDLNSGSRALPVVEGDEQHWQGLSGCKVESLQPGGFGRAFTA
jgi:hypothetical protein